MLTGLTFQDAAMNRPLFLLSSAAIVCLGCTASEPLPARLADASGTDAADAAAEIDQSESAWEVAAVFTVECTREELCTRTVTVSSADTAAVLDAYGEVNLSEYVSGELFNAWRSIAESFGPETCGRTQAIDVVETLEVCVTFGNSRICIDEASSCHGYGGENSAFVSALRETLALVPRAYDCEEWSAESLPFEPFAVDDSTERFACY